MAPGGSGSCPADEAVVSGYYGYANAGDEAVLAGMLATFREVDPSLELVVLSGDPEHTRRTHGVAAVRRTDPPAVVHALRASDGLISGGGSLLQDRTSPRPIAYYTGVMHLARVLGRRYVVHAQGLGPIHLRANRWLAAAGLRGAARVTLRDAASIDLARELGVRRPIELAPDPALALVPKHDGSPRHILVAIRDWSGDNVHFPTLRSALRRLAAEHPILAMPMQDPSDREASERIIDGIEGAAVMPPDTDLEAQLTAIGGSVLVIGMRLHALILAAAAHVPALAISYDPKVDAFAAQVGQPSSAASANPWMRKRSSRRLARRSTWTRPRRSRASRSCAVGSGRTPRRHSPRSRRPRLGRPAGRDAEKARGEAANGVEVRDQDVPRDRVFRHGHVAAVGGEHRTADPAEIRIGHFGRDVGKRSAGTSVATLSFTASSSPGSVTSRLPAVSFSAIAVRGPAGARRA